MNTLLKKIPSRKPGGGVEGSKAHAKEKPLKKSSTKRGNPPTMKNKKKALTARSPVCNSLTDAGAGWGARFYNKVLPIQKRKKGRQPHRGKNSGRVSSVEFYEWSPG